MKLVFAVICLPCCVAALPGSAAADWEYARWGMTAPQVIAASKGAAAMMPPSSQYRNQEGRYEITVESKLSGPPALRIGFMFDLPGGGLRCVLYNASGADVAAVRSMLVQRYGAAAKESSFNRTRMFNWTTPDTIELVLSEEPVAAVVSHCAPGRQ